MTVEEARRFAAEWISAWNAHDLDRILSHYASEIVLMSPVAERALGDGRVVGLPALRAYWRAGLDARPDLRFELDLVLVGHRCLTILYRNQRQQQVAETIEFNQAGQAVRTHACYGA